MENEEEPVASASHEETGSKKVSDEQPIESVEVSNNPETDLSTEHSAAVDKGEGEAESEVKGGVDGEASKPTDAHERSSDEIIAETKGETKGGENAVGETVTVDKPVDETSNDVINKADAEDATVESPTADDEGKDGARPDTLGSSEDKSASGPPTTRSTDTPECLAKPGVVETKEVKGLADAPTNLSSDTNPSPDPTLPSPELPSKKDELYEPPQGAAQAASQELSPAPATGRHPSVLTQHSGPHSRAGIHTSLSLNQVAIAASAQNKLPTSRLKGILERLGKHTESSAGKRGPWYKSETGYVDMNSYSWKNIALYKDYQQQMWTDSGTIKLSCKK